MHNNIFFPIKIWHVYFKPFTVTPRKPLGIGPAEHWRVKQGVFLANDRLIRYLLHYYPWQRVLLCNSIILFASFALLIHTGPRTVLFLNSFNERNLGEVVTFSCDKGGDISNLLTQRDVWSHFDCNWANVTAHCDWRLTQKSEVIFGFALVNVTCYLI